jgi:hypothetical protein
MSRATAGSALVVALAASACAVGADEAGAQGGQGGQGGGALEGFELAAPTDPKTCDEAALARSYVGCEFWPTVSTNPVWSIFDYAIVVANIGAEASDVTVEFGGKQLATTTVGGGQVLELALPWVPELKGPDADTCGHTVDVTESVVRRSGAYHLTSSRPIVAYQFSALEYEGKGGADDKDWSTCPGLQDCTFEDGSVGPSGCFSFTNDASLLLPSTAMSGTYRAAGAYGRDSFLAITATQDGTTVEIRASATASFLAGADLAGIGPGGSTQIELDAGDVVQLVSDETGDLAGTLVQANKPVQVLTGAGCISMSDEAHEADATCDHVEESIQPAETLGRHYVVTAPTGPFGQPDPYRVRIVGNVDGTSISYPQGAPEGAASSVDAGGVVDLAITDLDFEIQADHEIAVSMFMMSAVVANPENDLGQGDPSQTQAIAVEQYRNSYVFLAPDDYDVSFVDIVMPLDAKVTLDGADLPAPPSPVGSSGLGVARVRLGNGLHGAHALQADQPVGLQVLGYGSYTSYQYPAGLNFLFIAPPPK